MMDLWQILGHLFTAVNVISVIAGVILLWCNFLTVSDIDTSAKTAIMTVIFSLQLVIYGSLGLYVSYIADTISLVIYGLVICVPVVHHLVPAKRQPRRPSFDSSLVMMVEQRTVTTITAISSNKMPRKKGRTQK